MAAPTGTVITTQVEGNREDLSNDIYRIAPEQTPFLSNMGKTSADAVFHEWQVDDIDAVDTGNRHAEGDDTTTQATETPDRVGNYTRIFKKAYVVSGTQQAVDSAGIEDAMDYAKTRKMIANKRDMEAAFLGKQASVGGATRDVGGAFAWLTSNVSRGTGGASGGFSSGLVTAPTDGTQRDFTEVLLKDVMEQRFLNSGERGDNLAAYMHPAQKEKFDAFAGLSETRDRASRSNGRVIYGYADIYVSGYGEITTVPHPYMSNRDVLLSKNDMWSCADLRPASDEPLAKTGDNDKRQIVQESTLKCHNEKAHAVIADLTVPA